MTNDRKLWFGFLFSSKWHLLFSLETKILSQWMLAEARLYG